VQTALRSSRWSAWRRNGTLPTWLLGLVPVLLLAILLTFLLSAGPIGVFRTNVAPLEDLQLERIELRSPEQVSFSLVNGGPEPVTVSQVLVDEAYQPFTISPGTRIPRLGKAEISVPYAWVEGEPLEVSVLTSSGATFSRSVDVASETPEFDGRFLLAITLLGAYAGVIPVFLGLLWRPFVSRLEQRWLDFLMALTGGLLLFIGVEAFAEALETAEQEVAAAFQGRALVLLGAVGAVLGLALLSQPSLERQPPLRLAYLIAIAIGLHNLGEGLAIGGSYSLGNVALGALLVTGFMLHNTTEGLAIVAPLSGSRCRPANLLFLGLIAGGPTIVGTLLGGLTTQPRLSVVFLSLGAGAVFLVLYQVGSPLLRRYVSNRLHITAGFLLGMSVMYVTGLFAVA
jgi:zinc transporter, ZIP family